MREKRYYKGMEGTQGGEKERNDKAKSSTLIKKKGRKQL